MSEKVCNMCGKILDDFDLQNNPNIHTTLCYGSKYDGSTIDLDLCSDCWDSILTQMSTNISFARPILDQYKTNKNIM